MNIGKFISITSIAAGIAAGSLFSLKSASNNHERGIQATLQECRDMYKQSAFDINKGILFAENIDKSQIKTDAALQKLLSQNKFSNPKIFAKSNFDLGHVIIHNCNEEDIPRLKELLEISPYKPFSIIERADNVKLTDYLFKTQNDNAVSFALNDIGNKAVSKEYTEFQTALQKQLGAYFKDSKVSFDKSLSQFSINPSKSSNILLKDALMFFPDNISKNGANMVKFGEHNSWVYSLFFNPKAPISKTINIPYTSVVRALKKGLKSIR